MPFSWGPWLADTIRQCDGLVDMLSYWTFSDVFEEQGVVKQPFYGGFGLIAEDGLPKPAFNAFKLLHQLGAERLANDSHSAFVTRQADGALGDRGLESFPARRNREAQRHHDRFQGITAAARRVRVYATSIQLTARCCRPYDAMGRPSNPTRQQITELRRAAPNSLRPETQGVACGRGS